MEKFNAEQFEQIEIEGENATSFIPIPEDEYTAFVEDYKFQVFSNDDGESVALNLNWLIPDEELATSLGLEELRVRQTVWLDLTESGQIDFGANKNVQLGRLRQALDLNSKKKAFQWADLSGKQGKITVTQREDKIDSSIKYSQVSRVASAESLI